MTLLVLDTAGIQSYIFRTSRLQQIVGASGLVALATGDWAFEALPRLNNVRGAATGQLDPNARIEHGDELAAEVIYAGGGNMLVLFRESEEAQRFGERIRRKAAERAPGLSVVWATIDIGEGKLKNAVHEVFERLHAEKLRFTPDPPPLAPPGVQACAFTGLAAEGFVHNGRPSLKRRHADDQPASIEVLAKLAAFEDADRRLKEVVPPGENGDSVFGYPREFADLGRELGEDSHLGVVHADGDGIGQLLMSLGPPAGGSDRAYIESLRAFSTALAAAATEAQKAVIQRLIAAVANGNNGPEVGQSASGRPASVRLVPAENGGHHYLPIRPLVYGGDDLTLVCDGRLAHAIALAYCEEFAKASESRKESLGGGLSVSAGLAIVPLGSPFARAYRLAEELTRSAKRFRRESGWDGAALDWHLGATVSLQAARKAGYQVETRRLNLRPLAVGESFSYPQRWDVVEVGVQGFRSWPSTLVKQAEEALRRGDETVKRFTAARRPLPDLPDLPTPRRMDGWDGHQCLYHDAAELADLMLEL